MHHTRSYPVALFDLHGVFFDLGALGCSQRFGVVSPVSIVSGDGYSVVEARGERSHSLLTNRPLGVGLIEI